MVVPRKICSSLLCLAVRELKVATGWDDGASASSACSDSAGAGVTLPAARYGGEGEEGAVAVQLKQFPMRQ